MPYSRSQLIALSPTGEWVYCRYNIGDLVIYEGSVHRVTGFSVLQTDPCIFYDIGIGRGVAEDNLEDYK